MKRIDPLGAMSRETFRKTCQKLLKMVQAGHIYSPVYGICGNVALLTGHDLSDAMNYVEHYAKSWPYFSGNGCFPVPDYWDARQKANSHHWRWEGSQLQYRISLLKHIIRKTR